MIPEKQKEHGAYCVAIGLLFLSDYFVGQGKSKNEALSLSADVIASKVHGIADILNDTNGKENDHEDNSGDKGRYYKMSEMQRTD